MTALKVWSLITRKVGGVVEMDCLQFAGYIIQEVILQKLISIVQKRKTKHNGKLSWSFLWPHRSILAFEIFFQAEAKLYRMLLDIRMKLAKDNGTAPYAICGDQTIKMITKRRPSTRANLARVDGVNQHLVTKYGDSFLESISRLSQKLNLPLDNGALVWPTVQKGAYTNSQRKTSSARFEAWKAWEKDGLSFQEIANFPTRLAPIKEQTVISYVLEAARDGCELSWTRFCDCIGMTLDIAMQIRGAIAKIGSTERLKLIKEELPENVGYDHIKTLLTVEELGVKVKELFAGKSFNNLIAGLAHFGSNIHQVNPSSSNDERDML